MSDTPLPEPDLSALPDDEALRVWWHVLRPDRLRIADEIDRAADDYDRGDTRNIALALRHVARWLRASAGEVSGV